MMPAIVLVGVPGPRWLPPIPIPLFLLWPFVLACPGIARLMERRWPAEAATLRAAMQAFGQLRGLAIAVDTAGRRRVRIRFV